MRTRSRFCQCLNATSAAFDLMPTRAERQSSPGADKDALPTATTNVNGKRSPTRHSPSKSEINLNTISACKSLAQIFFSACADQLCAADARILMSHEHRALGFRPPPGSLAAEAQSAAARHPDGDGTHIDDDTLREIALRDAERIKADRELNLVGGVDVSTVGKGTHPSTFQTGRVSHYFTEGASDIVSAEAKVLGRSPKGNIAPEAQSPDDKHPEGSSYSPTANSLELDAVQDAARNEGEKLREAQDQDGVGAEKAE